MFVSILVHELGHAFMQRFYGGHPWITLYGFGGLASCDDCDRSPRSQIHHFAGRAGGGFLAGRCCICRAVLSRLRIAVKGFRMRASDPVQWIWFDPVTISRLCQAVYVGSCNDVVCELLQVNILWGLVNLLPIYPLDGGRIARELFTLGNPRQGIVQSLWLSIGVAVLMAVYALTRQTYLHVPDVRLPGLRQLSSATGVSEPLAVM